MATPFAIVPPDLVKDEAPFDPMQLARQFLQGFCIPNDQQMDTSARSAVQPELGGTVKSDVPRSIQLAETSSVLEDYILAKEEEETCKDSDDEDDENNVFVETVSGPSRSVRAWKGLELFLCTISVFVLTVKVLKCAGVNFGFALHPKIMMDNSSSMLFWSLKE